MLDEKLGMQSDIVLNTARRHSAETLKEDGILSWNQPMTTAWTRTLGHKRKPLSSKTQIYSPIPGSPRAIVAPTIPSIA